MPRHRPTWSCTRSDAVCTLSASRTAFANRPKLYAPNSAPTTGPLASARNGTTDTW